VTSIDDHSIKCDPATMPPAVRDCYLTKGCPPEWKGLEWSQVGYIFNASSVPICSIVGNPKATAHVALDLQYWPLYS